MRAFTKLQIPIFITLMDDVQRYDCTNTSHTFALCTVGLTPMQPFITNEATNISLHTYKLWNREFEETYKSGESSKTSSTTTQLPRNLTFAAAKLIIPMTVVISCIV